MWVAELAGCPPGRCGDASDPGAESSGALIAALAKVKVIEFDPAYRDKATHDSAYDPVRDDPAFHMLFNSE